MLLSAVAVMSVLLHRVSQMMGTGKLARSVTFIVAYIMVGLASFVGNSLFGDHNASRWLIPRLAVWWSLSWLFSLAVAHRWVLLEEGSAATAKLKRDVGIPKVASIGKTVSRLQ